MTRTGLGLGEVIPEKAGEEGSLDNHVSVLRALWSHCGV